MTFVINALRTASNGGDQYFELNQKEIMGVAALIYKRFPFPIKTIWRGILLTDKEASGLLKPGSAINFLSFSDERDVALDFAMPLPDLRIMFSSQGRHDVKGYLIGHTPSPSEIIYHWSWGRALGVHEWFEKEYGDTSLIEAQKEIILKETNISFALQRINWDKESPTKAAPRIFE